MELISVKIHHSCRQMGWKELKDVVLCVAQITALVGKLVKKAEKMNRTYHHICMLSLGFCSFFGHLRNPSSTGRTYFGVKWEIIIAFMPKGKSLRQSCLCAERENFTPKYIIGMKSYWKSLSV